MIGSIVYPHWTNIHEQILILPSDKGMHPHCDPIRLRGVRGAEKQRYSKLLWHDSIMFFVVDCSSTACLFPSFLQDLRSNLHPLINSHDSPSKILSVLLNLLSKVLSVLQSRAARPRGCKMTFTPKRPTLPLIHSVDKSDTANKAFHPITRTLYFGTHVGLGWDQTSAF